MNFFCIIWRRGIGKQIIITNWSQFRSTACSFPLSFQVSISYSSSSFVITTTSFPSNLLDCSSLESSRRPVYRVFFLWKAESLSVVWTHVRGIPFWSQSRLHTSPSGFCSTFCGWLQTCWSFKAFLVYVFLVTFQQIGVSSISQISSIPIWSYAPITTEIDKTPIFQENLLKVYWSGCFWKLWKWVVNYPTSEKEARPSWTKIKHPS